ncbi:hypothetical protein LTS18_007876 [Coniosporium uncinatum]|uniref:Uncharacterized protein n=1 Tax=Coniosporium uncinatum TaxID=93489 RepID=A0ACC3DYX1_9PEZI|nr:hypothetical protein LTS18_007876 [Coniosporium uncinatum]
MLVAEKKTLILRVVEEAPQLNQRSYTELRNMFTMREHRWTIKNGGFCQQVRQDHNTVVGQAGAGVIRTSNASQKNKGTIKKFSALQIIYNECTDIDVANKKWRQIPPAEHESPVSAASPRNTYSPYYHLEELSAPSERAQLALLAIGRLIPDVEWYEVILKEVRDGR